MIDYNGNWKAEQNYNEYPENKWCDFDYIANWIIGTGYKPVTTIENLVEMVWVFYDAYLMDESVEFYTDITKSENNPMISIIDVSCFVDENGGLKEFDYYC